MRYIILIILFMSQMASANIALEQLNTLLQKKEARKEQPKQTIKKSSAIKDLSDNYYFVFIYRSTCPHCHNFAPVLRDFSKSFDVKISAYSLDSKPIEDFEAKTLTPELFQTFYVSGAYKPAVPALFLVNKDTLEAYAVLFGEASHYQLARRMNELQQHIEEKFRE